VIPPSRKYDYKLASVDPAQVEDEFYEAAVIVTDHDNVDYELILKKAKIVLDTRNVMKQRGLQSPKLWTA